MNTNLTRVSAASLSSVHLAAIEAIEASIQTVNGGHRAKLAKVLAMSNLSRKLYDDAVAAIKSRARVALQFHPDRIASGGNTVMQSLLDEGTYNNPFEITFARHGRHSSADGVRVTTEDRLFGEAHQWGELEQRPKYGALHLMLESDGPLPEFGSCYFLLRPEVSQRCSFSYLGTESTSIATGTLGLFEPVLLALLDECLARKLTLDQHKISPEQLLAHLCEKLGTPMDQIINHAPGRNFDHHVEAQVHGPVSLLEDVAILVADPSYQNKSMEYSMRVLCAKYDIQLQWHRGFRLSTDHLTCEFADPCLSSLTRRVARNGYLDASTIGLAAQNLKLYPGRWADIGNPETVLAGLSSLWRLLVAKAPTLLPCEPGLWRTDSEPVR